jgi:branched-chain amino acid transport system ATP-binding protein
MLEVVALSAGYRGIDAIGDVSLSVSVGAVVTVIGPNGAGKTTLLNAIMGVTSHRGSIRLHGKDISQLSVEGRVAAGLGLVPERRELFGPLSVEDNLHLGGYRFRNDQVGFRRDLERIYALFPALPALRRRVAGSLSGGERQMLAMGRALMGRPALLMLDEPSLGLAPTIVADMFRLIGELRAGGASILLVEQNARAALGISDTGYVLEAGRVRMTGTSAQLAADPRVTALYLGGDTAA